MFKMRGGSPKNRYYLSKLSMKHHAIMVIAIMKNCHKDIKIQRAMEKNHYSYRKKNSMSGR